MSTKTSSLKYHLNCELRQRIARALDHPTQRYEPVEDRAFNHDAICQIAAAVGVTVDDDERDVGDLTLSELFPAIGDAVGVEYRGNAGCQWRMRREMLKAILLEVEE